MATRRYILPLFFLVLPVLLHAQSVRSKTAVISGRVLASGINKPLGGANVWIEPGQLGCGTDSVGFFEIRNIPEGTYVLFVSAIFYPKQRFPIQLSASDSLYRELSLQPGDTITNPDYGLRLSSPLLAIRLADSVCASGIYVVLTGARDSAFLSLGSELFHRPTIVGKFDSTTTAACRDLFNDRVIHDLNKKYGKEFANEIRKRISLK